MAGTLDRNDKLSLVTRACAGDSLGDDLALFVHTPLKSLLIFVVDIHIFAVAEAARSFLPLLLVLPLRTGRPVGVHRKCWFSYHVKSPLVLKSFEFNGYSLVTLLLPVQVSGRPPFPQSPVHQPKSLPVQG